MLRSPWFDQIDRNCPLPEYPRPQFRRADWQCLNGEWEYAVTPHDSPMPHAFDGTILVPFAIESACSGVQRKLLPTEKLWYRRTFSLDARFTGKRCLLHFGAVDWKCAVFVNGTRVCTHTGGYNPFFADITDYVLPEDNTLVVVAYDPTDAGWQNRGKQSLESHGFWYTATSGIWQTVWLEPVSDCRLETLRLTPDIDRSELQVRARLPKSARLRATVRMDGSEIFSDWIAPRAQIPISALRLWSPEDPFLYTVSLDVYDGDVCTDHVDSYFGMRKFSVGVVDGVTRLFLNNAPYFQRGLLDQGYYCDGGLTAPTEDAMVYDIVKMKELGFNMLRKHIKVEPARWYYHCDRLGMLVWQDMVSGGKWIGDFYAGVVPNVLGACPRLTPFTVRDHRYKRFSRENPQARADYETELREMIDTLYNVVSIYCWVPFNEGWGQFDAVRIAESVKAQDPTRIVDHASGWYDQGAGDVMSMHKYIFPIPKIRPDHRAFVVSEFGGYSLVLDDHVWNKRKSFGYMMFRSRQTLTAAYEKLFRKQILPLIPQYLSAFIYTQVSDVEFEVNGILTYDRKVVKIDEKTIQLLNQQMQYGKEPEHGSISSL